MTTNINCQVPECEYSVEHASEAVAIALYNSHQAIHQREPPTNAPQAMSELQRAPRMERPIVGQDILEECWNNFARRWDLFKKCTSMGINEISGQLFQCCEEQLGNQLLKEEPHIVDSTEEELVRAMKRLAVIPVAISVRRAELLKMQQGHGESARSYYARVKGKAATCNYIVRCVCNPPTDVDFTSTIIRDIVVAGLADVDIRK